ncbi:MAG: hypothetical protein QNJ54_15380 [Prochloraceae cyanobacterium]|nr:hypothetical protein [Prochloraceae cyanobacterium]
MFKYRYKLPHHGSIAFLTPRSPFSRLDRFSTVSIAFLPSRSPFYRPVPLRGSRRDRINEKFTPGSISQPSP